MMKSAFSALLSLGVLASSSCLLTPNQATAQQLSPQDAQAILAQANDLLQSAYEKTTTASTIEDFTSIIEICLQARELDIPPQRAEYGKELESWALNRRGQLYLDEGAFESALADFEKSLLLDDTRWLAYHNRGFCYANLGNFKLALQDFEKTLALNPDYGKAYINRGEVHYAQGDFQKAVENYSAALRLDNQDAETFNRRGHALFLAKRYQDSLNDYNQAIRLNPRKAEYLINRGDLHYDRGEFARASADFRQAFQVEPRSHRAYASAAWMMATCRDQRFREPNQSLQAAQRAIELLPEEESSLRYRYLEILAAAQATSGMFEQAAATQEQAISVAPPEQVPPLEAKLENYRNNRPWRD
ncbi:Hypothetical protein PBC10988_33850 [Planctomycetales bacterium 10988]|nr:Hypothetical protein PBC10988_33850 [Planctomycetales bacterium 10988]